MPESSDSESISSIVIPQRMLFTQKENQHQKMFGQVFGAGSRETLSQQNKTNIADKTAHVGPIKLFNQGPKRSKPVFPAALLNISPDKTVTNKTKEMTADLKAPSRHLFGNRAGTKRRNMFADFIVSESEDDISEVQPKMFAFALNKNPVRHSRSMSRGVRELSPASNITTTDIEMDDWNMLPSSTMVEQQLEPARHASTPGKHSRLGKLSETLESVNTYSNTVQKAKKNEEIIDAEVQDNIEASQEVGNHEENQEQEIEEDNREYNKEIPQNKSEIIEVEDEHQTIAEDQNASQEVEDEEQHENKENENEEKSEIEENEDEQNESAVLEKSHGDVEQVQSENQVFEEQEYVEEHSKSHVVYDNNEKEEVENEKVEFDEQDDFEQNESQIVEEIHEREEDVQNENKETEEHEDSEEQNEYQESHEEEEANEDIENEEYEDSEGNEDEQNESKELEENSALCDEVHDESQELEEQEAEDHGSENKIEQDDVIDDSEESHIEDAQDDQQLVYEDDDDEEQSEGEQNYEEENYEEQNDEEQNNEVQNDVERNDEEQNNVNTQTETESDTPDVSHDTTGRNRKKQSSMASPEAILRNMLNEMDTFTAKGRNTSIRKTKSILKNFTIRQSLAPPRDSTGLSDGTKNSSAEGSGWDSHRTTRKTLRQTFGKDFTPRKSLRTLVLEKSAKRQTITDASNANLHQANSTELPPNESNHQNMQVDEDQIDYEEDAQEVEESTHEISKSTRLKTLEMHLQKMRRINMERKLKVVSIKLFCTILESYGAD